MRLLDLYLSFKIQDVWDLFTAMKFMYDSSEG